MKRKPSIVRQIKNDIKRMKKSDFCKEPVFIPFVVEWIPMKVRC